VGDWFRNIWYFSDRLDGELEVRWGELSKGYSGQGFIGTPRSALIDEKHA
jgi:hypothetical protein